MEGELQLNLRQIVMCWKIFWEDLLVGMGKRH